MIYLFVAWLIAAIIWLKYQAYKAAKINAIVINSLFAAHAFNGTIEERAYRYIDNIAHLSSGQDYEKVVGALCNVYGVRLMMDDEGYLISERTRRALALNSAREIEELANHVAISESRSEPLPGQQPRG